MQMSSSNHLQSSAFIWKTVEWLVVARMSDRFKVNFPANHKRGQRSRVPGNKSSLRLLRDGCFLMFILYVYGIQMQLECTC